MIERGTTAVVIAGTTNTAPAALVGFLTNAGLVGTAAGPLGWALMGAAAVTGVIVVGAEGLEEQYSMTCWKKVLPEHGCKEYEETGFPAEEFFKHCEIIYKGDALVVRNANNEEFCLSLSYKSSGDLIGLHCEGYCPPLRITQE